MQLSQHWKQEPALAPAPSSAYLFWKRAVDMGIALLGLIATAPVMGIFAVLIMLESPGSPLYRQERLGLHGRPFTILKLRSMRLDAEKHGAPWAAKHDPRITKIGKFIRKTRIDELPQFLNVLKGEMSLIGPRPERPHFYEEFSVWLPQFHSRLAVKPGITGWAQVNGGYEIGPEEKLALDLFYIASAGAWLDLRILYKTCIIICTGTGAR